MKVYCIRHGESEANLDPSVYLEKNDHNIDLSKKGREQSIKAGHDLHKEIGKGDRRVIIFYSPYERTKQTMEHIKKGLNQRHFDVDGMVVCHPSPIIREQEYKVFEDSNDSEAKREEMVRFGKYWYRFKNAESMADVFGRAMTFYNYLVNKVQFGAINPEEDIVVIVSHCGFLKNLRGVCEGTDVDHIQDDIINNAKIFEIDLLKKI
jgi:broad specificity phosphatase PhoE